MITAAADGETVRFIAPGSAAQIRVQILSVNGDSLFDSAWKDGNFLDWSMGSLAHGSYRCVVTVKGVDGQVSEKELMLTAEEITNESSPKITLLAHDGANGAIVSTCGDLSFRFGNFLAGKDNERMRLTADGDLRVDGVIRASKGIMFSDGTVLTTAAGLPGIETPVAQNSGNMRQQPGFPGPTVMTRIGAQAGLPVSIPKRLNPAPTAGPGYQFKVDSAGVHIGTTPAFGLDVAGNVTISSNLVLPATSLSGSAGVIRAGGHPFAHTFGTDNTFFGLEAGNFTMTGFQNAGVGPNVLSSNTSGSNETATGYLALYNNTDGNGNTASGAFALSNNTGGSENTANGYNALSKNTTGDFNTACGGGALHNNIGGSNNTASGSVALYSNTSGHENTAVGFYALFNNITGFYNTATGY